ncbi:uncharacterized protein LOC135699821 [Ochlerotatus camptorhynchus]|uniref:uncharacterized protein LOC135699821 n=1 Tax=Ochlerotatus camptorhynchus TaxID=644619 RepID=UPI0031D6571B
MFGKHSALLIVIQLLKCIHGLRVNLTTFGNCQDVSLNYDKVPIALTKVSYDRDADGVCNTLHAEYEVRKTTEDIAWELILTSYKCPLGSTAICLDNPKEYIEPMHCERFHSDDSGPWFMLASAMTNGDKCGRHEGVFNLDAAVMKIKYLHSYTDLGKGTYRVRMLFHIPGTDLAERNVKGCCELDFDVIDE